jgi:hypothetical protein
MLRLPPPLRRCFAALATLALLFAPVAQVAHAQAMAHTVAACGSDSAMQQQMPASHHSQQHQHDGACCDFCGVACATVAVLPAHTVLIAPLIAPAPRPVVTPAATSRASPAAHLLPFSQGPPSASA